MIEITLNRRDVWENPQQAFDSFRKKPFFKQWSDEILQDYIDSGLKKTVDGRWKLTYSKEWEAHFFGIAPKVWMPLREIDIPVVGIRGETSNTLTKSNWKKWQRLRPDHRLIERQNKGHLIPFEEPNELARIIKQELNS